MTTPSTPLRVSLVNGSFESPAVSGFEILPDASQPQARKFVPGWRTTATDHMVELWRTGFNGVPSIDGQQFAELNANQVSTLYQDLPTTPGTKLYWRLFHRGRQGRDTMALDIGPVNAPVEQGRFTDGNTAWGRYTGTYVVPAGQTLTRFAFRSVSAAGGNQGIGNFLDGIFFGTAPRVELTKIAVPQGPLDVGDVLTYRVTARNEGGGPAENLVLTDVLPEHTTYVPGSLRIVDGPGAGAKTDARGDDQAYYDAAARTVFYHLGAGANATVGGSLANTADLPDGSTIEYRVRIEKSGRWHTAREHGAGDVREPAGRSARTAHRDLRRGGHGGQSGRRPQPRQVRRPHERDRGADGHVPDHGAQRGAEQGDGRRRRRPAAREPRLPLRQGAPRELGRRGGAVDGR
ncbi:cell wall surface anchor family protein [Streptomyces sp. SPB78]|nr:cell wall surface anchor family protein [Streptomyces sp. SPB78]